MAKHKFSPEQVAAALALPMEENDSGADTVRGYLVALLVKLWDEEEGFSGKRPFGNSGWQYEVYRALAAGGAIKGRFDEEGDMIDCDRRAGHALIAAAIASFGGGGGADGV